MRVFGCVAVFLVGCGSPSEPAPADSEPDPSAACSAYVQSLSACINTSFADPVAAANARDSLTNACDPSLAGLYGDAASEADAAFRCFARVIGEADCTTPDGFADISRAIIEECVPADGGALAVCEEYIDVATECINLAIDDPAIAEQNEGLLEGVCNGTDRVFGTAREAAIELFECYIRIYEQGDCSTVDGLTAITMRLTEECSL